MIAEPKVLILDVETKPLEVYVWDLREQTISLSQIKNDSAIMAWAAKWLGAPASKTFYKDQRNAKQVGDDKEILKPLWKLLDEADIVITQNGQRFDGPKLNARFMLHGWKPPKPYKHLDTYKIVKRVAQFTSHKLEYLTANLCTRYKKISHGKFPGMRLWAECLKNNVEAWEEMRRYNILDVLSTEELYQKIKAWAPESFPKPHHSFNTSLKCATCGEMGRMQKRGTDVTKVAIYARLQCRACGTWQRGDKIVLAKRAA